MNTLPSPASPDRSRHRSDEGGAVTRGLLSIGGLGTVAAVAMLAGGGQSPVGPTPEEAARAKLIHGADAWQNYQDGKIDPKTVVIVKGSQYVRTPEGLSKFLLNAADAKPSDQQALEAELAEKAAAQNSPSKETIDPADVFVIDVNTPGLALDRLFDEGSNGSHIPIVHKPGPDPEVTYVPSQSS